MIRHYKVLLLVFIISIFSFDGFGQCPTISGMSYQSSIVSCVNGYDGKIIVTISGLDKPSTIFRLFFQNGNPVASPFASAPTYTPSGSLPIGTSTLTIDGVTNNTYDLRYSRSGCASFSTPPASLKNIFVDGPTFPQAGVYDDICEADGFIVGGGSDVTPPSGAPAIGSWLVSGPATAQYSNQNDPYATIYGLTIPGIYDVTWNLSISGCGSAVQSLPTSFEVYDNPIITSSLSSTICGSALFNYTLTSDVASNVDYYWERQPNAGITQPVNSGSQFISEQLTNSTANTVNVFYILSAAGSNFPNCQGLTYVLTVTVLPNPIASSNPALATVCSEQPFNFALTSNLPNTTFSWTVQTLTGSASGISAGAGSNIIQTPVVFGAQATFNYIVTPLNTLSGCSAISPLTIPGVVNPLPTINGINASPICTGTPTNITYNSTPAASFSWVTSFPGALSGSAGSGTGASITETLINNTTSSLAGIYIVTPTIVGTGCVGSAVNINQVVYPAPIVTSTVPGQICSQSAFVRTITSNIPVTGFTISRPSYPGSIVESGFTVTGTSINEILTGIGASAFVVTYHIVPISTLSCTGVPFDLQVTVNPLPTVTGVSNPDICSASTTNLTLNSNPAGATFGWSRGVVAGISNGAGSGTGATISEILFSTTTTSINTFYTITPTIAGTGCVGPSTVVSQLVNPLPTVTGVSTTPVCNGSVTNITFTGTPGAGPFNFNWATGAFPAGLSASSTSGSVSPISVTMTNSSASTLTGIFVVTPTIAGTGCVGSPLSINQVVYPSPTVTSAPTGQICSAAIFTYTITSNLAGSTFQWSRAAVVNIIEPSSASGSPFISETLTNSSTVPVIVSYIITVTGPTLCPGNIFTLDVTVSPKPTITGFTLVTATICSGVTTNITPQSNIAGTVFTFTGALNSGAVSGFSNSPATVNGISQLLSVSGNPGSILYSVTPVLNGCVGSAVSTIQGVNPLPTITGTNPAPICFGQQATLTVSGADTYTWSPSAILSASTGASVIATPVASGVFSFTVGGTNTLTGCQNSANISLTVNTVPAVNISGNNVICSGQSTTLSGTAGLASYSWLPGGAVTPSIVVSPVSMQTYTLTGTNGSGCISTSLYTVTVNSVPLVTVGGTSQICTGQTATISGIAGLSAYNWQPGSLSSASIMVSPASTTVYTLTGSNASGCSSIALFTLTVNPVPNVNISGTGTICSGSTVTLTGTPAGLASYDWQPLGSVTSSVVLTPLATTPLTLTGTSSAGCSATSTFTVTVNPVPTIAGISPSAICAGQTAVLTVSGNATSYSWSPATTPATGTTVSVTPSVTTTYTVTGTTGICSTTLGLTVTVNPLPTVSGVVTSPVCSGSQVNIPLSSAPTGAVFTITSPVVPGISGNTLLTVVGLINDILTGGGVVNYSVTGSLNGCTGPLKMIVQTVTSPVSQPSFISGQGVFCQGTPSGTYQTQTLATLNATTLGWNITPGLAVAGSASAQHVLTVNWNASFSGNVTITATAFGCGGSLAFSTVIGVNPLPTITSTIVQDPSACGSPDGAITVSGIGSGTLTFTLGAANMVGSPAVFSGLAGGSKNIILQDVNGCSATTTVGLNAAGSPPAPIVASSGTAFCTNAFITVTGANTCTGVELYLGSVSPANLLTSVGGTYFLVYTTTVSGNYIGVAYLGACASVNSNTLTITVTSPPSAPGVTSPVTYCQNSTATPLTATGSNLTWYTAATTIGGIAPTPSTAVIGSTNYFVSQSVNGCASPRSTITSTVVASPAAPSLVANGPYCQNATASVLGHSGAGTIGWYTSSTSGAYLGGSFAVVPVTTAVGTTTYFANLTSAGSCVSPWASVNVSVTTSPVITVTSSPSVPVCSGDAVNISFASTGGATLGWSRSATGGITPVSGSGNSSPASDASLVNSNATSSVVNYLLNATVSGCSTSVTVPVTVLSAPVITSYTPVAICSGSTANITLPSGFVYTWTGNLLSGTGSFSSVQSAPSAGPINDVLNVNGVVRYTITPFSGSCAGSPADIDQQVNPTVGVPAIISGNDEVCVGGTYTYVATASGATLITYFVVGGSSPINTLTGVVTWNTGGGIRARAFGCGPPRASPVFAVSVNAVPTVTSAIAQTQSACGTADGIIVADGTGGNAPYGYSLNGGAFSANNTFTGLGTGSYTVSIEDVNGCTSSDSPLAMSGAGTPDAPDFSGPASGATVCTGSAIADITYITTVTGGIIGLYEKGILVTTSVSPLVFTPLTGAGAYAYTADVTVSGCNSTLTSAFTYTVTGLPKPLVPDTTTICDGNPLSVVVIATATGTNVFDSQSWTDSDTLSGNYFFYGFGQENMLDAAANGSSAGIYTYHVRQQDGTGCYSPWKQIIVKINPTTFPGCFCDGPTVSALSELVPTCQGQPVVKYIGLTGTAPFIVTITGGIVSTNYVITINGSDIDINGHYDVGKDIIPTTLGSNTYNITGAKDAFCDADFSSDPGPFTILVNPSPVFNASSPAAVCNGLTVDVTNTSVTSGFTTGLSYFQDSLLTTAIPDPTQIGIAGRYYITLISISGVGAGAATCTVTSPIDVSVKATPTAVFTSAANTTICGGNPLTVGFTGTGPWVLDYMEGATPQQITSATNQFDISTNSIVATTIFSLSDVSDASCYSTVSGVATVLSASDPLCTCSGNAIIIPQQIPNLIGSKCAGENSLASITVSVTGGFPVTLYIGEYAYNDLSTKLGDLTFTGINNTISNLTVSPNLSSTYKIDALQTASCYKLGSSFNTADFLVNPKPLLSVPGITVPCTQTSVDLTNTALYADVNNTTGTGTYWADANATVPLANAANITASGVYYVQKMTNQGCFDIKPMVVTFQTQPQAVIGGGGSMCPGIGSSVSFSLNGTQPFTIIYTDGSSNYTVPGIASSFYTLTVNPVSTTGYSLVSVSDAACTGNVSGTATVTVLPASSCSSCLASGSVSVDNASVCGGGSANVTFNVTGTGSKTLVYSVTGAAGLQTVTGIASSVIIGTGALASTTTYVLVSVADQNCLQTVNQFVTVTVSSVLPATPTITGATNILCQGFTANWSAIAGTTLYVLEISTVPGLTSGILNINTAANSFTLNNLHPGVAYYYRVSAVNGCGTSGYAAIQSTTPSGTGPSAAPVPGAASAIGCGSFTANWATTAGATNYIVEIATTAGISADGSYQSVTTSGLSNSFSGLLVNTEYFYRVTAINLCGSGPASAVVNLTTTGTAPAAPVALAPLSVNCTDFVANWQPVSGATSYNLYVATTPGFDPGTTLPGFNGTSTNSTSLGVGGLVLGVTYYYAVEAVNTCGVSPLSFTVSGTTVFTGGIATPSGLNVSPACSSLSVGWTNVSNASGYVLDYTTIAGFGAGTYVSITTPGLGFVLTGLGNNTTAYFRVSAYNSCGSGMAASVSGTTLDVPAIPVTTIGGITCTDVTLSWLSVPGVSFYELEYSTVAGFGSSIISTLTVTSQSLTIGSGAFINYRLRAFNGCGYSGYSSTVSGQTLAVPTAPGLSLTVTASNQFDVSWLTVPGVNYTTEWSTDGFVTVVTIAGGGIIHSGNLSLPLGVYDIRVAAYNTCGYGLYSNTVTGTVSGLSATITGPAAALAGTTATITFNLSGTAPFTGILYTAGSDTLYIASSGNNVFNRAVTVLTTTTYMVIGYTDANGKNNLVSSIPLTIYVTTPPQAVVYTGPSSSVMCDAGILIYTVSGTAGLGVNPVYTWLKNGATITGFENTQSITVGGVNSSAPVTVTDGDIISVQATSDPDTASGIGNLTITKQVAVISINNQLVDKLLYTPVKCTGGSDGSISVIVGNNDGRILQYSIDGGLFQSTPTFANLKDTVYTVIVRDSLNQSCMQVLTSTGTGTSNFFPVIQYQSPSCGGADGYVQITPNAGSVFKTYDVTITGLTTITGVVTADTTTYTNLSGVNVIDSLGFGDYYVMFGYNGCSSTAIPIHLTGATPPYAYLGNDTTVCLGTSITLQTQALGTGFSWYIDNVQDSSLVTAIQVFTPVKDTTEYTVRVQGLNSCFAESSVFVYTSRIDMKLVTTEIDNDKAVDVKWHINNLAGFPDSTLAIQRRATTPFVDVWTVVGFSSKRDSLFLGSPAETSQGVFEYRIVGATNAQCASDAHNTIWLKGTNDEKLSEVDLHWNTYNSVIAKYSVIRYEVWRKMDDETAFTFLADAALDTFWVKPNVYEGFRHHYRVKAITASPLPDTLNVWSNIVDLNFARQVKPYNAFSPNGDGHNDYFEIDNILSYPANEVFIFNRWGTKVYYAKPYVNNWNGDGMPDGTYFYILKLNDANGTILKGNVLLQR